MIDKGKGAERMKEELKKKGGWGVGELEAQRINTEEQMDDNK